MENYGLITVFLFLVYIVVSLLADRAQLRNQIDFHISSFEAQKKLYETLIREYEDMLQEKREIE